MSTTEAEDYVKRAEECLRLAGACIAESTGRSSYTLPPTGGCWPKKLRAEERTGPNLTKQIQPRALRMMSLKTASCEPPAAPRPSDQFSCLRCPPLATRSLLRTR